MEKFLLTLLGVFLLLGAGCGAPSIRVAESTTLPGLQLEYSLYQEGGVRNSYDITLTNKGTDLHACKLVLDPYHVSDLGNLRVRSGFLGLKKDQRGSADLKQGDTIEIHNNSDVESINTNENGPASTTMPSTLTSFTLQCSEGTEIWPIEK